MTLSRRHFCAALGAAGLSAAKLSASDDNTPPRPLRVMAYNVYVAKGWPDDRPLARQAVRQGQMARRLAQELALYQPDVICLSESPSEAITKQMAAHLDMHHVRFPSGGNWPGTLLSRFEIADSANVPLGHERPPELFTRHWGRGTLRLADGQSLVVHSVHLHPAADPAIRLKEVRAMLASMQADLQANRPMLLIGDLNHETDADEYRLWKDAGWVDTFAQVGQGAGLTFRADKPYKRIDYVLAAGPLAETVVESRPLFQGAFRLNLADEHAFALSDHLPHLAVFGGK